MGNITAPHQGTLRLDRNFIYDKDPLSGKSVQRELKEITLSANTEDDSRRDAAHPFVVEGAIVRVNGVTYDAGEDFDFLTDNKGNGYALKFYIIDLDPDDDVRLFAVEA